MSARHHDDLRRDAGVCREELPFMTAFMRSVG